ncbi:hypothetical protein JTE90_010213 [Oedothorax gibbosus]|uniref:Uncharacterized protein n=1 Tax=Oedothorax gibbosus TaxID=931172 RepID=A0AAV6UJ36_9ARAC|nr:hypothetical protein JTE90_010213 [Oedothorax gibbosus]
MAHHHHAPETNPLTTVLNNQEVLAVQSPLSVSRHSWIPAYHDHVPETSLSTAVRSLVPADSGGTPAGTRLGPSTLLSKAILHTQGRKSSRTRCFGD